MAETKNIRIKAAKDSPEFIAHGNLHAERKGGYFATDDRRFADHIINSGHGTEVGPESKVQRPKAKKQPKAKAVAEIPPAKAGTENVGGTE